MSAEQNKAVAHEYIQQVWKGRRPDLLERYMAADVVHHDAPGLEDRESIRNFITMTQNTFPDLRIRIEQEITEGDLVVFRQTISGTQQSEFMGMPASRKPVTYTGIYIFRIAGGKIAELWGVSDVLSMMQQLGVIPAIELS